MMAGYTGSRKERRARYKRGWIAEWVAACWLMLKGYSILEWRFRSKAGEIDLIAKRGRLIAFVEVKARRNFDDGLLAVSYHQQQRILQASDLWMQKHEIFRDCELSFDVIAAVPWKGLKHYMHVFSG